MAKKYWKFQTKLGGGLELFLTTIFSLLMMKRERFFYFNFVLALYMGIMCYFKLVYADPRPFMITDKIKPIGCYSEYGNPSGHSWASMTFPIILFLD